MDNPSLIFPAIEIQVYAALLLKFFNQALEERLRARGESLSSLQYGILRMLVFETLTISELSRRLGMDPATLVRSVDALERKGLAQRGSDPRDRRRNPVHITEKGSALMMEAPVITPQDQTWQAFTAFGMQPTLALRDQLRALIQQFPEGRQVTALMSAPPPTNPTQEPTHDSKH